MKTYSERIEMLRGAFASSLKYCPRYEQNYPSLWKEILSGGKCPASVNLLTLAGDYFAFWFNELKLPPQIYFQTAKEFFTVLYPEDKND